MNELCAEYERNFYEAMWFCKIYTEKLTNTYIASYRLLAYRKA